MPFRGLTKVVYTVIGECIILYLDIIEWIMYSRGPNKFRCVCSGKELNPLWLNMGTCRKGTLRGKEVRESRQNLT